MIWDIYDRNRRTLYEGLTKLGFTCVKPEGAFYLWLKSPEEDERQFVEKAKKYNILMVPGRSFACPGMCVWLTVYPMKRS